MAPPGLDRGTDIVALMPGGGGERRPATLVDDRADGDGPVGPDGLDARAGVVVVLGVEDRTAVAVRAATVAGRPSDTAVMAAVSAPSAHRAVSATWASTSPRVSSLDR